MRSLQSFRSIAAAIVVVSCCLHCSAQSFTPQHRAHIQIFQEPDEFGSYVYGLETFNLVLFANEDESKLIAPDGTEFLQSPNIVIRKSSFEEIASIAFGDWTAVETYDGQEVSYQFRVEPFSLGDVFSETPIITSPTPGSEVPSTFVVKWEYPLGGMPSGRGISYSFHNLQRIDANSGDDDSFSYEFITRRPRPGISWIDLQLNNKTHFPDPEIINNAGIVGEFTTRLYFESRSAPARYYVVPEPRALCLAYIAIASTVMFIGRGRCVEKIADNRECVT